MTTHAGPTQYDDDYYTRTDPVVVKLLCEAERSSDTQKIDRAEWNAMTPAERAVRLNNMMETHMANAGGGGWHIPDPQDEAAVGNTPAPMDVDAVLQLVDEYRVAVGAHADALRARIRQAITR